MAAAHRCLRIKAMSMAFLTDEDTAMVRGPMASGALVQMLEQTLRGELDVLLVDMPPGTGDIQLTLAQKVTLAGAVIITTPQDIALIDARKGVKCSARLTCRYWASLKTWLPTVAAPVVTRSRYSAPAAVNRWRPNTVRARPNCPCRCVSGNRRPGCVHVDRGCR